MRIRIVHETRYAYEQPARGVLQILRLTPRSHGGQRVLHWRVEPSAEGRLRAGEDPLGNRIHTFSADEPLSSLALRAVGEVLTSETAGLVRDTVETAPDPFYLRETPLTAADAALRTFAEDVAGSEPDALARLHALTRAVFAEMRFDTGPTDASTTAAAAFGLRRGVCQDLTHVFLAAARHFEIPCRYVSGYFRRADGVVEQEAGHAWAEAKVPGLGWVGFDPANGISTTEAHVRVAIGLDYHGAAPVRGSRRGGGTESLAVRLRVEAAGGQSQSQSQSQG